MGASNSKLDVLWYPAQGGKAGIVKEKIQEQKKTSPHTYINILIGPCNISVVHQTGVRMVKKEDYEKIREAAEPVESDAKIEGSVFSWHSGTGVRITVDDIIGKILTRKVDTLSCCAHSKRLKYLRDVITQLAETYKEHRNPPKLNIWIDEADASMCYWRDMNFQDLLKLDFVEKVTMVSATVDAIVETFKTIRIIPCENTTLPIYFRAQDLALELVPYQKMAGEEFVKMVAEGNLERYFAAGVRTFAPVAVERRSHYNFCDWALSMGAIVVLLNGDIKAIHIPSDTEGVEPEIVHLPKPKTKGLEEAEEIGKSIGRIYKEKGLEKYPLFITGNYCLGRGITFQNKLFLFDHNIIPPAFKTRAAAYQATARGLGNITGLPNFVERAATGFKPTLVTTPEMWKDILEAEKMVIAAAKNAHATGNCLINEDDLAILSDNSGGLEFSHIPVRFPLPAELQELYKTDKKTHNIRTWRNTVLECLSELDSALHKDIVDNYEPNGHVNNYSLENRSRLEGMFTPMLKAAKGGRRARVPKFDDEDGIKGKNIWYAALDQSGKIMVICRWEGKNYV